MPITTISELLKTGVPCALQDGVCIKIGAVTYSKLLDSGILMQKGECYDEGGRIAFVSFGLDMKQYLAQEPRIFSAINKKGKWHDAFFEYNEWPAGSGKKTPQLNFGANVCISFPFPKEQPENLPITQDAVPSSAPASPIQHTEYKAWLKNANDFFTAMNAHTYLNALPLPEQVKLLEMYIKYGK